MGSRNEVSAGCSHQAADLLILPGTLYRGDIAPVGVGLTGGGRRRRLTPPLSRRVTENLSRWKHPRHPPAQITAAIANTASAANIPARSMDVARDARTQSGRVQAAPLAAPARMTMSTTAMPAR